MGRTLNYKITKEKSNFNKKELEKIYDVCKYYNSDDLLTDINSTFKSDLKELWTCEDFWIGLGNFYPDWHNNPIWNRTTGWDAIHKRFDELKDLSYYDQLKILQDEKLIIDGIPKTKQLRGFTKTQGNELNSMLVLQALITISNKLPNATITISDEGEYLMCPLTIKKGLALPNVKDLLEYIQYYSQKMLFSKGFEGNILDKLDIPSYDFSYEFTQDLNIENSYGDMTKYIKEKLRNLKDVETVLKKNITKENELYFFNLKNREPKKWFNPILFTRKVVTEKFLTYECTPGTLMDGFSGEGFGLSDKDSESESYKSIAKIQKLLGITKDSDLQLEIGKRI